MTVSAALRLPALRRGAPEVLAGRRHLDRMIRWVHAAEVPNIAALLKGGELLLTTGMGLDKAGAQQRLFIDELYEREIAALVIELGQHLRRIPDTMIGQAEKRGLPLVALHREIPFIEVTESIHAAILGRQFAALRRGEQIHRQFTELLLGGAGIPEILASLAQTIANPVLLEKTGHGVLYHAAHRAGDADVLAAWELRRHHDDPETSGKDPGEEAIAVPVPQAGSATWGRLIALPLDSPLDEYTRVAAERAVALIALTLMRSHQEEILSARERGNFLADVAAERVDLEDAPQRAGTLGFRPRGSALLIPLAIATPAPAHTQAVSADDSAWTPVWQALLREMHSRSIPSLVGTRTSHRDTLVLLAIPAADRRRDLIQVAATAIHHAARRYLHAADPPVIAAGRAVASWRELPAALRESAGTASIARASPPRHWHDATTADIDRLLLTLRENPDLRNFVHQRLQPLIEHDRSHATKLLPTLQALLDHQGRKTEAARTLHLERQSLYHRIQRIEKLLDSSLDDPTTILGLHLALRARRYLERTTS
ncbi:MAG: PucR family transcriptional regulator ligand-binding domain-containing protein [Solirubrobacterales bacterium]|nr:PucR family transcriptional regulator ligand-binding domain-containing protein [Solirubrobacterales bacterium]